MDQLFEFVTNNPLLIGAFVVLLTLFIRNETQRGGRSVSAQQLVNLVNQAGATVVDVRDNKEFAVGHIVDAVNIPFSSMDSRWEELKKYQGKHLIVVCKMGQHANAAGTILRKNGFEHVLKLTGGMMEWRNQSLPVVKS